MTRRSHQESSEPLIPQEAQGSIGDGQDNRESRYLEKIKNPEAIHYLEENYLVFLRAKENLIKKIDLLRERHDQLDPSLFAVSKRKKAIRDLEDDLNELATILVYGQGSGEKFHHVQDPETIQSTVEHFQAEDEEKHQHFSPEDREKISAETKMNVRRNMMGQYNASLYAIGLTPEQIQEYLSVQVQFLVLSKDLRIDQNDPWLTLDQRDFEFARHRAYFEARRTGENLFTHVTSVERLQKIIAEKSLQSSNIFSSNDAPREELNTAGQTGNIQESVFFTSEGGGYWYGSKKVGTRWVRSKPNEFVMFVASGNDILSSGNSIDVSNPSLEEHHEGNTGRAVTSFAGSTTKLSLEYLYIVVAESQYNNIQQLLKDSGYSDEYISIHLTTIPEQVVQAGLDAHAQDPWNDRNQPFEEYIQSQIKPLVLNENNPNKNRLFATVDRRKTRTTTGMGKQVFKWQRLN